VERGGDLTDTCTAAHFRLGAQPGVACERRTLLDDPAGGQREVPLLLGRRRQRRAGLGNRRRRRQCRLPDVDVKGAKTRVLRSCRRVREDRR
jgi:hypothetical protein